jgi:hypothetical protein
MPARINTEFEETPDQLREHDSRYLEVLAGHLREEIAYPQHRSFEYPDSYLELVEDALHDVRQAEDAAEPCTHPARRNGICTGCGDDDPFDGLPS